jgi:threonine/homoserine/homoserine lactone efflux protein
MFAYDLLHWSSFFGAAILLVLSPGPDHIFVLSTALKQGRRAGYAALAGIVTGLMMHTGAVAFGLAALIAASPEAFQALKLLGGLYLVYLGIKALRSMGIDLSEMAQPPQHVRKTYAQGLGINILNPKIAIFFLAFLPQFVVIDAGPCMGTAQRARPHHCCDGRDVSNHARRNGGAADALFARAPLAP